MDVLIDRIYISLHQFTNPPIFYMQTHIPTGTRHPRGESGGAPGGAVPLHQRVQKRLCVPAAQADASLGQAGGAEAVRDGVMMV